MTSIEVQESFANSQQAQSSAKSESQKETLQLSDTPSNRNDFIDISGKKENKASTANTVDNIKPVDETPNDDAEKHENEEEVIILENDSGEKGNGSKTERVQRTEESDVISSIEETGSKINRNDNAKEITTRSANSLKRKQRNFE